MLRKRGTSGGGSEGTGPRAVPGREGTGPTPLLSTVLLQFAPFLSAEDLIPSRWGLCRRLECSLLFKCFFNVIQFGLLFPGRGWGMLEERLGQSQRTSALGGGVRASVAEIRVAASVTWQSSVMCVTLSRVPLALS